MSDTTISNLFSGGGGNLEFVYTIGGLPFGFSTSQTIIDLLASDTTIRRVIFGKSQAPLLNYPADNTPIFPILKNVSGLNVKTDNTKGLSINGYSVTLDNIHQAIDLSNDLTAINWPDMELWGFPTIHSIIDPRRTENVHYGKLSRTLLRQGTKLYFTDDYGLKDYIDSAGDIVLYVNQEPVHISASATCTLEDSTLHEYSVYIDVRNLFRYPDCTHRIEDYSTSVSYVSSFPLGSASGRKGYVWCFILNDNRDAIVDYFLYQHGAIESNVTIGENTISISHRSPLGDYKTPLKFGIFRGQLEKYVLTRGNETSSLSNHVFKNGDDPTAATPHLLLFEWDDSYGVAPSGFYNLNSWKATPVWLCKQNEVVVYDTLNDLIVAINNELRRISPYATTAEHNLQKTGDDTGTGTTYNPRVKTRHHWSIVNHGMLVIPDTLETVGSYTATWNVGQWEKFYNGSSHVAVWQVHEWDQCPVLFGGQLAVPLNLGMASDKTDSNKITDAIKKGKSPWTKLTYAVDKITNDSIHDDVTYRWKPNATWLLQPRTTKDALDNCFWKTSEYNILGESNDFRNAATPYLMSWYDNDDTESCVAHNVLASIAKSYERRQFPIPVDPDTSKQIIHICNDIDPSLIQADQYITLGFDKRVFKEREKTGQRDGEEKPLCASGFISELIETDTTDPVTQKEYAIVISGNTYDSGTGVACLETIDDQFGPWEIFDQIMWCPTIHEIDPWQIRQGYSNAPQDHFADIIEGILGGSTDFVVSASYRLDNIPESNTRDDFISLIDFDAIRKSVRKISSKQLYKMPNISYDNELMQLGNVWDMLQKEILIHGHQMTYEFDPSVSPKMFRVRTRPIASPSWTEAKWNNRVLNESMMKPSVGRVKHWDSWQYTNINTKFSYDGKEYRHNFNFLNEKALANIGGQDTTLTIGSKLSQLDNSQDITKARDDYEDLYNSIGGKLLYNFSFPAPTYEVNTTLAAFGQLSVGQSVIVTDDSILNPFTGKFGNSLSEAVGFTKSMNVNLMKNSCDVGCELHYEFVLGASPGMKIDVGNAYVDYSDFLSTYLYIDPEDHEYSKNYTAVDLSWYDCYIFNPWTQQYNKSTSCSCTDYAIYTLESNPNRTASQISGTVSNIVEDGNGVPDTAKLNIDTTSLYEFGWDGTLIDTLDGSCNSCQSMAAGSNRLGIGTDSGFYYVDTSDNVTKVNTYQTDVVFADENQSYIWFVKASDNTVYEQTLYTTVSKGIPSATGTITCGSKKYDEIVGYDSTNGNVYKWVSGTTWTSWGNPGGSTTGCTAIISDGSNSCTAAYNISTGGCGIYQYNGSSWSNVVSAPVSTTCVQIKKVGTDYYFLYMSGSHLDYAVVYKWDGSSTWTEIVNSYDAKNALLDGNPVGGDEVDMNNTCSFDFLENGDPFIIDSSDNAFLNYTGGIFRFVHQISTATDTCSGISDSCVFNNKIYSVDSLNKLFRIDTIYNNTDLYVYYEASNSVNLQSCQEKFTWLADKSGKYLDNVGTYHMGDRID